MYTKQVIQRQADYASQVIDENNNEEKVESEDETDDVALVD
jgi:hypothetical protein